MRPHANRTYLFTPGNHERRVEKALGLDADAVILDLEDAVAVAEKVATRAIVRDILARPRQCAGFVRVNAYDTEFCHGDIDAIALPLIGQGFSPDWQHSENRVATACHGAME